MSWQGDTSETHRRFAEALRSVFDPGAITRYDQDGVQWRGRPEPRCSFARLLITRNQHETRGAVRQHGESRFLTAPLQGDPPPSAPPPVPGITLRPGRQHSHRKGMRPGPAAQVFRSGQAGPLPGRQPYGHNHRPDPAVNRAMPAMALAIPPQPGRSQPLLTGWHGAPAGPRQGPRWGARKHAQNALAVKYDYRHNLY